MLLSRRMAYGTSKTVASKKLHDLAIFHWIFLFNDSILLFFKTASCFVKTMLDFFYVLSTMYYDLVYLKIFTWKPYRQECQDLAGWRPPP